ncbi:uncharacterized protein PAC_18147 [Phialocephala subalpina]|uniref:Zn(2)-C6 fungal-type domain-containing protein n=1 Tax=Phialocephala subalpina TaxID=576137 RepID=A0A1L7XTE9_9HELO|nr:uncharacterized protein PAC_18147 [Phialocephala subalpina]
MNSTIETASTSPRSRHPPPTLSAHTRGNGQPRRRARVACHLCHERKVRCDVSLVGSPCTNCRLDAHACSVRDQAARRRPKKGAERQTVLSPAAAPPRNILAAPASTTWEPGVEGAEELTLPTSPPRNLPLDSAYEVVGQHNSGASTDDDFLSRILAGGETTLLSGLFPSTPSMGAVPPMLPFTKDLSFNSSVTFSCYGFLELRELTRVAPEDVRYLESKGCFHVPSGPRLDQLVRQYFLHVHPYMPVLDEEEFWYMFARRQDDLSKGRRFSLLVFQAMLFTASPFASLADLRACGFQSYHSAREILHQRARLLYDFRTEIDSTAIAQASLLLSFHSTSLSAHDNTSWLSTAVQYARDANLHLYYCTPGLSSRQRSLKKRLWWCCVLRDRVIALGVRRHIQITPDHFDLSQEVPMEDDFAGEIERSEVYDSETKRLLVKAFAVQCQLAVALTSTIMAVYPLNGLPVPLLAMKSELLKVQSEIEKSKEALAKWVEVAMVQLAPSPEYPGTHHNSVTLYADLTYIYFFSAQIAVCHYTIYLLNEYRGLATDCMQQLQIARTELERGIFNITRKVTSLLALGLVGYLPISLYKFFSIAYTALPLALLSLDVKLSSTNAQQLRRKHRLASYTEVMRLCSLRFDFADVVAHFISKLLQLTDFTPPSSTRFTTNGSSDTDARVSAPYSTSRPRGWYDVLVQYPQLYFRILFSLDFSLSRGRYPCENELPCRDVSLSSPKSPAAIELAEQTQAPNQRPISKLGCSLRPQLSPQQNDYVQNPQFDWLQEGSLTPSGTVMQIYSGESASPLHNIIGFSGHPFEMDTIGVEAQSERIVEEDADQVLSNIISDMFNPSPTEGLC